MLTTTDTRQAILDAMSLLLDRLDATTDPQEKASLKAQVTRLNVALLDADFQNGIEAAAKLNALADVLNEAIAQARAAPFNGFARKAEDLLDQIGATVGAATAAARPQGGR